jgi:5'-nucleotidase
MTRILVTNDDGVRSPGLAALTAALEPLGEVTVVAPLRETSAIGHALTLHRPLRLERIGERRFALDGTPSDCVNIAVVSVLKELPQLVVSGINLGLNLGDDLTYSGTVSAALEGALLGVPAIAMSAHRSGLEWDFRGAARAAAALAEAVLKSGLPPRILLNVNVPAAEPKGVRVTVQGRRNHVTSVEERTDPRGRAYFWIDVAQDHWEPDARSDYQAVRDGFVSVTPLHPDLTAHAALVAIEELSLGIKGEVR